MMILSYITSSALLTASLTAAVAPFGALIDKCTDPGQIALTFDDGPFMYTADLLDILSEYGAACTFFVNGHNFGDVWEYSDVIKRIVDEGHQLGSHTWNHADLTTLDRAGIQSEMTQLEDALRQIPGRVPVYMRPPYLAVNNEVFSTLSDLGYHVIGTSIDTKDYENNDPALIANSYTNFQNQLNAGGSIVLSHDVHEQTVHTLARQMLDEIQARGLTPVTVGDCLGEPEESWYK